MKDINILYLSKFIMFEKVGSQVIKNEKEVRTKISKNNKFNDTSDGEEFNINPNQDWDLAIQLSLGYKDGNISKIN